MSRAYLENVLLLSIPVLTVFHVYDMSLHSLLALVLMHENSVKKYYIGSTMILITAYNYFTTHEDFKIIFSILLGFTLFGCGLQGDLKDISEKYSPIDSYDEVPEDEEEVAEDEEEVAEDEEEVAEDEEEVAEDEEEVAEDEVPQDEEEVPDCSACDTERCFDCECGKAPVEAPVKAAVETTIPADAPAPVEAPIEAPVEAAVEVPVETTLPAPVETPPPPPPMERRLPPPPMERLPPPPPPPASPPSEHTEKKRPRIVAKLHEPVDL